jgi:hypothetical protein
MNFTDEASLGELAKNSGILLGNEASGATLHFCSPAHGGWGVIRTALLVPEAYLLFVCPSACGRHGAIAAIEQGQRDRLAYLCLEDREIVLGTYQDEITKGARKFMEKKGGRVKALMIFTSCIDDLLGTDHDAVFRELEKEFGVPIRHGRMNPITLSGPLPPPLGVQKTMYEFLEAPKKKDNGVLLLGCFKSPGMDSELARFLAFCGAGAIRHPDFCDTFESFCSLSQSAVSLIIRPEGKAAAEHLSSNCHIQAVPSFIAFDRETILHRYRNIASFFNAKTDGELEDHFAPALQKAGELERKARLVLGDAEIALDSTATCAPFSLALALVKAGLKVKRIYTNQLPEFEKPAFTELCRIQGDIIAANPSHAKRYGKRPEPPLADISIGFEAAYASASPVTVPLAFDEGRYGFEGYTKVLGELIKSAGEKTNLQDQVKAYGLVV